MKKKQEYNKLEQKYTIIRSKTIDRAIIWLGNNTYRGRDIVEMLKSQKNWV